MISDNDLFPVSPRVIYKNNPLTQVVCQLKFPTILKIDSAPPADFQELIRSAFPLLERAALNPIMEQIPAELAKFLGAAGGGNAYMFRTEDKKADLYLTEDSLSLSTNSYVRWEDFLRLFRGPLNALISTYRPSYFSRIGLRYQNAVQRSKLKLNDRPWSALLSPEILGEIKLPRFEQGLVEAKRVLRLKIQDTSDCVFLQHGLATIQNEPETAYLIDFDFYTDSKIEGANVEPILNRFNSRAGHAFRWCIGDELHNALGPDAVAN